MGSSGIILVISGLSKTRLSDVLTFWVGKGPDGGGGGGGAFIGGGGGRYLEENGYGILFTIIQF